MNTILSRAVIFGVVVAILLARSIVRVKQARTQSAVFQLVGACLLAVVVLAHVAEGLPLLPGLEWGQPHSVGHYMDFLSFVAGIGFLIASVICWLITKARQRVNTA
jgi:hypothetical protein